MLLRRCRQVCLGDKAFALDSLGNQNNNQEQLKTIDPARRSLLNELFKLVDANENGVLDREELEKVMQNPGLFLTLVNDGLSSSAMGKDAFIAWSHTNIVKNLSDGKVKRMRKLLQVVSKIPEDSTAEAVFERLDLDGNNTLSLAEFQQVLGEREALFFSQLDNKITEGAPAKKRGYVTKEEFVLWASSNQEEYQSFIGHLLEIRLVVTRGVFALFDKVALKVQKNQREENSAERGASGVNERRNGTAMTQLAPPYCPAPSTSK
jgi:Ca2+-binding EF-hand superfamily protein